MLFNDPGLVSKHTSPLASSTATPDSSMLYAHPQAFPIIHWGQGYRPTEIMLGSGQRSSNCSTLGTMTSFSDIIQLYTQVF